eukprot:3646673-Amphidinium_carterae.1
MGGWGRSVHEREFFVGCWEASRDAESTATQIEGILKSFLPPRVLEAIVRAAAEQYPTRAMPLRMGKEKSTQRSQFVVYLDLRTPEPATAPKAPQIFI